MRAGVVAHRRMRTLRDLTSALNLKSFGAVLLRRLGPFTPLRVAIICLVVLACVTIPVALAVSMNAGSRPAALDARGKASITPPPGGSSGISLASAPDPSSSPETASLPDGSGAESSSPDPVSSPTPAPTPTPPPHPSNTIIREGITAPVVAEIQTRLMDLGYMDEDEPTQYFGPVTSSAISLFQRQHMLTVDGRVGMETYNLLMGDEAQRYTVTEGASGQDVTEMQDRLRELGYLDKVTGNFGELTTKAVKAFQQYNDLAADGKVGQKTRELIYSADAKAYFLKYGEQSDEVKNYQKRLKSLGYLTTEPEGKYGKDTVAAVRRFQDINGLIADGFLGPDTVDLLMSGKAQANALVLGMSGNDVQNVQRKLKTLGYISHVTGYFGSETEDGVKAFQKRNTLTADGMVGQQTLSKITSGSAKKAATGGSGKGGSGSGSTTSSNSSGVGKLIAIAESKLGKKYVWGAKGPNTFDCSGFIYYCLNHAGVKQGYLTSGGWASSSRFQKITSISSLKRGDILVFSGDSAGHVGIYLGSGRMIDASSANGKVIKRSGLWSGSYWSSHFICAFRVY
jgi:peptidoglycan hydrolase-like protein with peptidoglycan-binding domain